MTERQRLWIRGALFGALYTPGALSLGVAATFSIHAATDGRSLEGFLRVLGAVALWALLLGIPLGVAAGAVATVAYAHWRGRSALHSRLAALGAAVGCAAALASGSLLSWRSGPSISFIALGTGIGTIGGFIFPWFANPGAAVPLRKTLLTAVLVMFMLMLSQAALWASWVHGAVILTSSNGAPIDTLTAEIRKVPTNVDPAYMYFPDQGFYCYRIAIFLDGRGGPPISSSCLVVDSVHVDSAKVAARWEDSQTLRADIDEYFSVEVIANIYGPSRWRSITR